MHYFFLLTVLYCVLSGCSFENIMDPVFNIPVTQQDSFKDPNTGKTVKMWVPKNMLRTSTWPFQARGEEVRCSDGFYWNKKDYDLLPSQRSIYKVLPNKDRVWAYYYYYGEDSPLATGGEITNWYITVFNIYAHPNGDIYACYWAKFPSEYRLKYGTSDGIDPNIYPPR